MPAFPYSQDSPAPTGGPVPIMAFAGQAKPYFSTLATQAPLDSGALPLGACVNAAKPYFSTTATTAVPFVSYFISTGITPVAFGQSLPFTVAASPVRPYFS